MLNKFIKSILFVFVCIFNTSSSSVDAMTVKGEIELADINEELLLYLNVEKSLINEMIRVDIKVNDEIVLENQEYITHYLGKSPIVLKGFEHLNESKKIYINIRYREIKAPNSNITFTIKSPTYEEYKLEGLNYSEYINDNPTKIIFYMYRNNPTIYFEYESVLFHGEPIIKLNGKRTIEFENFKFYIDSRKEYELEYVELRIFHYFEESDLLYKNDFYSIIEIPISKQNDNYYKFIMDTIYYISEVDGNIFLNPNENTNQDLLQLFIPFSINEEMMIKYEIVLYDIGINHSTYIYQGYILTNDINKHTFSYKQVEDVLEDVTYE